MSTALDRNFNRARSMAGEPAGPPVAEDESDISALIARLTAEVNQIACEKTKSIQHITNQMKMLALNALIESSRAGAHGAGFAVVAQEVRSVGQQVEAIARELETQLTKRTGNLMGSIERMTERSRGERMVDLSLNAIELIDRNLYERTCDVRWWATDSAIVDCAAAPDRKDTFSDRCGSDASWPALSVLVKRPSSIVTAPAGGVVGAGFWTPTVIRLAGAINRAASRSPGTTSAGAGSVCPSCLSAR